jgi:prepilin-type N-terminal cleavage/methylation domain-containing protein
MNKTPARITQKGFTVVELLIAIVVIGILATVVVVAYNGVQASARDKTVLADLDSIDGIETRCGLTTASKTQCGIASTLAAKAWYSGNGVDSYLQFTPSTGNVIDVVVNSTDYCIRGYNLSATTYTKISLAAIKESTPGACTSIAASGAAVAGSP